MAEYDSSDDALYRAVSAAELEALIQASGRPVVRDAGKLVHLLTRVRGTLAEEQQKVAGLQRQIVDMRDKMGRVGQATTLNPLDAVRWLDDEQLELAFTRIARERLAMLRSLVDRAEDTRARLEGELAQVRSAAEYMAQRADLPLGVRGEFASLLGTLPRDVPPVTRPGVLDYPDPDFVPGAPDLQAPVPAVNPFVAAEAPPAPADTDGGDPFGLFDDGFDAGSGSAAGLTPQECAPSSDNEPAERAGGGMFGPGEATVQQTGALEPEHAGVAVPGPPAAMQNLAGGERPQPATDDTPAWVDPYAQTAAGPTWVDPHAAAGPPAWVDPYAPSGGPGEAMPAAAGDAQAVEPARPARRRLAAPGAPSPDLGPFASRPGSVPVFGPTGPSAPDRKDETS